MMPERKALIEDIRSILNSQFLAVLSTRDIIYPYPSLVGFAASTDLKSLFFPTGIHTRKYLNMRRHVSASMLIDNRSNQMEDFNKAVALTALGEVRPEDGTGKHAQLELFLNKLPGLRDFCRDPDCALMRLEVRKYIFVSRLSEVMELEFT